jgi:cytochrome P450
MTPPPEPPPVPAPPPTPAPPPAPEPPPAPPPPASATPLLDAFDAIAAAGGDPRQIVGKQVGYIRSQIQTNALPFFAELRAHRPILVTPALSVVSRFRDVEEILHRETIFSVKSYVPHMEGVIGPFILSLDITPPYEHDKAAMELAVRRTDLPRVAEITGRVAAEAVAAASAAGGAFDIVQNVTRKTPVRLAAEYYGFDAPDDAQMMGWARACFMEFFLNIDNVPAVRAAAIAAGAEMTERAQALIAARRGGAGGGDDVLARLLAQQGAGDGLGFDDEGIVRTLKGLVTGMVETTSQACVQALAVLFQHPEALPAAIAAAEAGDDATLWAHIREALRFRPINPLVIRIPNEDYRLGAGLGGETVMAKDRPIFACTWSAMFDESVVSDPARFDATRPAYHYFQFAAGEHACFGRHISEVQVTQIVKAILRLKGVRPAAKPVYAGPLPDRFEFAVAPPQ